MKDTTTLIQGYLSGSSLDEAALYRRLYHELLRQANKQLRKYPFVTLDATAVIHEVWLRYNKEYPVADRSAFIACCCSIMRSVIVDYHRNRSADKRGGGNAQVTLNTAALQIPESRLDQVDDLQVSQALEALKKVDAQYCQVVELRFYGGFSYEEIAAHMDIAVVTAKRYWSAAHAFLLVHLKPRADT